MQFVSGLVDHSIRRSYQKTGIFKHQKVTLKMAQLFDTECVADLD